MKCPHCGEVLGEVSCPACQRTVPEGSKYCCWCGEILAGGAEDHEDQDLIGTEEHDEGSIDFSSRKLCSDGTCIGVIGSDGRCKECGKPYTGEPEEDESSDA